MTRPLPVPRSRLSDSTSRAPIPIVSPIPLPSCIVSGSFSISLPSDSACAVTHFTSLRAGRRQRRTLHIYPIFIPSATPRRCHRRRRCRARWLSPCPSSPAHRVHAWTGTRCCNGGSRRRRMWYLQYYLILTFVIVGSSELVFQMRSGFFRPVCSPGILPAVWFCRSIQCRWLTRIAHRETEQQSKTVSQNVVLICNRDVGRRAERNIVYGTAREDAGAGGTERDGVEPCAVDHDQLYLRRTFLQSRIGFRLCQ
ncbi:hypothetical protein C8Q77DRAFT_493833 [Trametes polyzona]|nr:hypothetical protein C8Q77DRAFT_493833 [Trametes polyzona]